MDNEVVDEKQNAQKSDDEVITDKSANDTNGCKDDAAKVSADAFVDNAHDRPDQSHDDVHSIDDDDNLPAAVTEPNDTAKLDDEEGDGDFGDAAAATAAASDDEYQSPNQVVEIAVSDSDIMSDYSPNKKKTAKINLIDRSSPSFDESAGHRNSVYGSFDHDEQSDVSSMESKYLPLSN